MEIGQPAFVSLVEEGKRLENEVPEVGVGGIVAQEVVKEFGEEENERGLYRIKIESSPHHNGGDGREHLQIFIPLETDFGRDTSQRHYPAVFQFSGFSFRCRGDEGHSPTRTGVEGNDIMTVGVFDDVDYKTFNFFNHMSGREKKV